ncbi:hypothetical protein J0910_00375 [Nocardiopsis sp. CNT-189]|uniref:hypothetical protein n=1 Tax=Nocardiopsis oceanisediminis TaxID=2816862 RepID=UPI003B39D0E6
MASISRIRRVLAGRLDAIGGLRVSATVPGSITPPAAAILPGLGPESSTSRLAVEYDKSFRGGSHKMHFLVKLAVSAAHDESGQEVLDAYLDSEGALSVKAAVESGLEALVHEGDVVAEYAQVPGVSHYGVISWGGVEYFGADLLVEVLAR